MSVGSAIHLIYVHLPKKPDISMPKSKPGGFSLIHGASGLPVLLFV
jgi:hypothetical protein